MDCAHGYLFFVFEEGEESLIQIHERACEPMLLIHVVRYFVSCSCMVRQKLEPLPGSIVEEIMQSSGFEVFYFLGYLADIIASVPLKASTI